MSLFRKHMEKVAAAQSQADSGNRSDLSEYELMLVRLHDDRSRIKRAQSTENKNAIKQEIFPEYQPWIAGVIESVSASDSEHYRQDDVFTQAFVWAIDLFEMELIQAMFVTIKKADMTLPDRFKRQPANFMLEQLANAVIQDKKQFSLDDLRRIDEITADVDIHDQVRAKWNKAIGLLLEAHDDLESMKKAAEHFALADKLDSKSGVKTRLSKLEKHIAEQEAAAQQLPEQKAPEAPQTPAENSSNQPPQDLQ